MGGIKHIAWILYVISIPTSQQLIDFHMPV